MTITHNKYYDMFHIGSIIRNKDLLSQNYNVHINITKQKQGGSNGRTYQMIQIIGSNPNIIKLQNAINIIEIQAENDYLDHKQRKRNRKKKTHEHLIHTIITNKRSMENNPFYGL
jgi:hypothetical protein